MIGGFSDWADSLIAFFTNRITTAAGYGPISFQITEMDVTPQRWRPPHNDDKRLEPIDVVDRIDELVNESLERGKYDKR